MVSNRLHYSDSSGNNGGNIGPIFTVNTVCALKRQDAQCTLVGSQADEDVLFQSKAHQECKASELSGSHSLRTLSNPSHQGRCPYAVYLTSGSIHMYPW